MINLIIPAAGAATRLKPLSSNMSKIMVRINGKPCLDYIMEKVKQLSELNEVIIVDGIFDDIRNYCEIKYPFVKFIKQHDLRGPRDAIKLGFNQLSEEALNNPTVVWLGDTIILDDYLKLGDDFLLCKYVDDHENWCMWDGVYYYNKPDDHVPNSVALVGLYSFSNSLKAKDSFNQSNRYDISSSLELYGNFDKVLTNHWYDIGDLPAYYKTCASLLNLKSRAFNNIQYDQDLGTIRKSPDYHNEQSVNILNSEKTWYKDLTFEQSLFTPRILDIDNELVMTYESGILLSDLMLYENLSESFWEYIIGKVFSIKIKHFNNKVKDNNFIQNFSQLATNMWISKSRKRLETIDDLTLRNKLINIAVKLTVKTKPIQGMHGDLHFGNILYNQTTDQIKFIDPRGDYGGYVSSNGDNLYDWCKLSHDLYHGYNAIIVNKEHNEIVKKVFIKKLKEYDLPIEDIIKGGLLLLATCIPLHYDDPIRQDRMIDYIIKEIDNV